MISRREETWVPYLMPDPERLSVVLPTGPEGDVTGFLKEILGCTEAGVKLYLAL